MLMSFDDLISEYVPSRNLRSSGTGMLTPRRVKCSFGEQAFATSAPVLWMHFLPMYVMQNL